MNYGLLYIFLLSLAGTVYNATTRNDAWLALFAIIAVGSAFWLSWRYHETARKYERRRIVERQLVDMLLSGSREGWRTCAKCGNVFYPSGSCCGRCGHDSRPREWWS
jgi:uncharacterized paraquat-inducible protein A